MAKILSKKYDGIYYNELQNGDKTYYITYKQDGKKVWEKIGKHSHGIREDYCNQKRAERIVQIHNGEETRKQALKRQKGESITTLNDLFDYYVEHKEMKPKSRRGYKGAWNLYIRNTLGECDAKKLTANDIIAERNKWALSEKTKAMLIGFIGASYRFSTVHNDEYKDIPSPMDNLLAMDKLITTKETRKKRRNMRAGYLKLDEINQLREAIENKPALKIAVEIMLSTGVRITGALSIRKRDIDLQNKTITLIDHKNGGDTYTGYISPQLEKLLEEQIPLLKQNDFIINSAGKAMPYRTIARHLKEVLDELFNEGLDEKNSKERIVIHSLRHTFASQLAIKGTSLQMIQKLLNHADISMTMRYAKLLPDSGKDAVINLYT